MMDVSQAELSAVCKSKHVDTLNKKPQLDVGRSHLALPQDSVSGEFAQCVIWPLLLTRHGATSTWSVNVVT